MPTTSWHGHWCIENTGGLPNGSLAHSHVESTIELYAAENGAFSARL